MNKMQQNIMQLYATLLRAHLALLDEITDAATSKAARRSATKASEAICATVYHMIHDTGLMPNHTMIRWISDLAPTADDFDFGLMDEVRNLERHVFASTTGGRIGFGLYPSN